MFGVKAAARGKASSVQKRLKDKLDMVSVKAARGEAGHIQCKRGQRTATTSAL